MADWLTIIFLLFLGVTLLIVEIIFVPGTTVVGIAGVLVSIYAIFFTFQQYGPSAGFVAVIGGGLLNVMVLIWAFKSRAWERFSLKATSSSRVNEDSNQGLEPGQEGITISSLRPIGKALIGDKEYEVTTGSSFLDSGKKIKIVRITNHRIVVEPLTD